MRIVIVFDDLTGGGAARIATQLANHWAEKSHYIRVITTDDGMAAPVFKLGEAIDYRPLNVRGKSSGLIGGMQANWRRISILRRAIIAAKPDVVISFLDRINVLVLLATRGLRTRVIVSERTDPAMRKIGTTWEMLRQITYPWADSLVCQGERPLRYFSSRIQRRACVIPNPVSLPPCGSDRTSSLTGQPMNRSLFKLVAMGSLRPEKGFDLLLIAFAQIVNRFPKWSLVIWGNGGSLAKLESQARSLSLSQRVMFPGNTTEPYSRLAEADLFVLSSRVEGFPNVLCEAMALGLPVVATDVGAVAEIVRPGFDGILITPNDVNAMAEALASLMDNVVERERLGNNAREVVVRFGAERVLPMWECLIQGTFLQQTVASRRSHK